MTASWFLSRFVPFAIILPALVLAPLTAYGEYTDEYEEDLSDFQEPVKRKRTKRRPSATETGSIDEEFEQQKKRTKRKRKPKKKKSKYFIEDTERVDAGIFHVAFAGGGNFYIEPKVDQNNVPIGEYFNDFGFALGVYFDYDYIDIPLQLRGFTGYKYILSSVHVFTFDGVTRIRFDFSKDVQFGMGIGASAAVWIRSETTTSPNEEVLFLPSFIINAGFDFNPFLVDFKWLINRFGENSTITGIELYFGVRL